MLPVFWDSATGKLLLHATTYNPNLFTTGSITIECVITCPQTTIYFGVNIVHDIKSTWFGSATVQV